MSEKIEVDKDDLNTLGCLTLTVINTPEYKLLEEFLDDGSSPWQPGQKRNERAAARAVVKTIADLSREAAAAKEPSPSHHPDNEPLLLHIFNVLASIIELASIHPPGKAHERLVLFLDTLRGEGIKAPETSWVIEMGKMGNERLWADVPGLHEVVNIEMRWHNNIYRNWNDRRQRSRHESLVHLIARWTARGEVSSTNSLYSPMDFTIKAMDHIKKAFQPLLTMSQHPDMVTVIKPCLLDLRLACIWIQHASDFFWQECLKADKRAEREASVNIYPVPPALDEFSTFTWNQWTRALEVAVGIVDDNRTVQQEKFRDGPALQGTVDLIKETYALLKEERQRKLI